MEPGMCFDAVFYTINYVTVWSVKINWLFIVLRPTREYVTHMETSPMPIEWYIQYAKACSAYDQFLNRGRLLTDKLLQGFQQSRLKAAFRKLYGRYNNLVYQYDLSLSQMLSDVFHSHC